MGLFGAILSKVMGRGTQPSAQNLLLDGVMGLLGNPQSGGLGSLVGQFASKGLGQIMNSWVGTGSNLPISPDQLKQGLGADAINQLAARSGMSPEQVSSKLTQLLPAVVDKLTPQGEVPPTRDIASKGREMLEGFLK